MSVWPKLSRIEWSENWREVSRSERRGWGTHGHVKGIDYFILGKGLGRHSNSKRLNYIRLGKGLARHGHGTGLN